MHKRWVYESDGRVNYIVMATMEDTLPVGSTEIPAVILAHDVLDVGHVYDPATFDATDPATYDPSNAHYPGPTPAPPPESE